MDNAQFQIQHIEVRFSLSQEVPVLRIANVSNLKFRLIRKEGKDYLSELAVLVSNSDISESVSIAIERARRLCNLISFKCRKGIITIYRGFLVTYIDGRTTVRGESPFIVWSDNRRSHYS